MPRVYPRLPPQTVLELLGAERGSLIPGFSHPSATPVATGNAASVEKLKQVRTMMDEALAGFDNPSDKSTASKWDAAAGLALHQHLDISASDASSNGVWSFLTLILLPDHALRRFPSGADLRMAGGQRNVFRRTWWRHQVLGPMELPPHTRPLGEDEMVNIFERSRLSRDHRLARAIAQEVLAYRGKNRSKYTRDMTRHVRALSGSLVLEVCSEEQIKALVAEAGHQARSEAIDVHL